MYACGVEAARMIKAIVNRALLVPNLSDGRLRILTSYRLRVKDVLFSNYIICHISKQVIIGIN